MAAPLRTHDLAACTLIVGGQLVTGFGETDAITITPMEDAAAPTAGADGQLTVSRSNNKNMTVEITVMQNSEGYKVLGDLYTTQAAQSPILRTPFRFENPLTGDKVRSDYFAFTGLPEIKAGKTVAEVVYKGVLSAPAVARGGAL